VLVSETINKYLSAELQYFKILQITLPLLHNSLSDMEQLPKDIQEKIESLENSVTEKQLAYQQIDQKLFGNDDANDPSLLSTYMKAKKELDDAVDNHISFFKSVVSTDPKN
jgi:hypothetical protein